MVQPGLIICNKQLLNEIQAHAKNGNAKSLVSQFINHTLQSSLLEKITERAAFSGFYNPCQNKNSVGFEILNIRDKWHQGNEITKNMRNLMTQLAEELNLDAKSTFSLLDGYFLFYSNRYHYVTELETTLAQFPVENQIQLQQLHPELQSKFKGFTLELKNCHTLIKAEAIKFYFEERRTHMQIISYIITLSQSQSEVGTSAANFITKLDLTSNLVLSLIRNLELKEKQVNHNTENLLECLDSEQIQFLKVIFTFCYQQKQEQAKTDLFFEYLQKSDSDFTDEPKKSCFRYQASSCATNLIKVLGQLTALAMMQLHEEPVFNSKNLAQIFDPKKLNQTSAFVIFPAFMILGSQQLVEWLKKMNFTTEVESILQSELITSEAHCDLRGPSIVLLRNWLCMAYEFMSTFEPIDDRVNSDLIQIQTLAIKLPADRKNIETMWRQGVENVKMLSPIINNPTANFPQYFALMDSLSGQKAFKFAKEVFEFNNKKNTFQEIFGWMDLRVQQLHDKQLQNEDIVAFGNACVVICKIIKQRPKYYNQLNESYKKLDIDRCQSNLMSDCEQSQSKLGSKSRSMSENIGLEQGKHSLLNLLVKALYGLVHIQIEFSKRPISNIFGALKQILKNYDVLKVEVISLLAENYKIPLIIQFMKSTTTREEKRNHTYKLTESFLDFITTIFDQIQPQSCLEVDDSICIDTSFLSYSLSEFYQPIIQSYFEFQFRDEIVAASFSYHLLKLTKVLLNKFVSIPDKQKCSLYSPMPRFEAIMQMIINTLSNVKIHEICLKTLELYEVVNQNESSRFENRFLHEFTENGKVLSPSMAQKMQFMVHNSLKVLNYLVSLSQQDNGQDTERYSRNVKYTRLLTSVGELQSLLKSSVSFHGMPIVAQIAFYVSPNTYLDQHYIVSEALHFLTCSMATLKSNNQEIYDVLKQQFGVQLKDQLMNQFKTCFNQPKFALTQIGWVEFWIQVIESQPKLIDKIMIAPDSKILVAALKNGTLPDNILLKAKILSMICQMSEKDCCADMISYNNFQLLSMIFDSCLEQSLSDAAQNFALNGQYRAEDENVDNQATINQRSNRVLISCISKINVVHFLKLLQNQFSRAPRSKVIRDMIFKISNIATFKSLSFDKKLKQNFMQLEEIYKKMNNDLRNINQRDIKTQIAMHNYLKTLQGFNQDGNKYLQSEGDVFLNQEDLTGQVLFEATSPHGLWTYLPMRNLINPIKGSVGAHFFIDINELLYLLKQEQYEDDDQILDAQMVCMEINLAMSMLLCDYQVLKCKSEFILNVASVQFKQAQGDILQSLYPIISGTDQNQTDNNSSLLKLCQETTDQLYMTLTAQKQYQIGFNCFHQKLNEAMIDQLVIQLGIILKIVNANQSLEFQDLEILMQKLLSDLPDIVTNSMSSELFMQLAHQTLLILQLMKSKKVNASPIITILEEVCRQMRRGNMFSQGVSILCSAIDLMDDQTVQQVMKKENIEPIRLILLKLEACDASTQEVQEILLLVQKYAERGPINSFHLFQLGFLRILTNNGIFKRIQNEDAYVTIDKVRVRNQCHVQWCQMLAILRTISGYLMENSLQENEPYFQDSCKLFSRLRTRIATISGIFIDNAAPGAQGGNVLSLALLEEIEMLCSVLSQMFDHDDLWLLTDFETYSELKYFMMLTIPSLFVNSDSKNILPCSITEQDFAFITAQTIKSELRQASTSDSSQTALQLKIEICLQRIMFSCCWSLLSIFNNKHASGESPLVNMIDQKQISQKQATTEINMTKAFNIFRKAQDRLFRKLKYASSEKTSEILLEHIKGLFRSDFHLTNEYQGGIFYSFLVSSAKELIDLMDITLVMSIKVSCNLLEQVRSAVKDCFQNPRISTNSKSKLWQDLGKTAGQLSKLINECQEEVKSQDNVYFSKLQGYVQSVCQNPQGSLETKA